jgi:type IV pilus assembly protein PilQ
MSVRRKALCFTMVAGMGLGVSSCAHSTYSVSNQQDELRKTDVASVESGTAEELAKIDQSQAAASSEAPAVEPQEVSERVLRSSATGVSMKLLEAAGSTTLAISAPKLSSIETLSLENPNRFVVDLYGQSGEKNDTISVANPAVSSVRLGAHGDKTRVVIDLAQHGATPKVTRDGSTVLIALSGEAIAAAPVAAVVDAPEVAQIEAPTAEVPVITASGSDLASGMVELTAMSFERGWEDSGEVVLNLSNESAYDLHQSAPSEYVLTLPRATAAKAATAPIIAPKGFPGIRATRVVAENESVQIRMFVDAGVSLKATPNGNTIKVTASTVSPAKDPSARAQAQMLQLEEVPASTTADLPREAAAPPAEEGAAEAPAEEEMAEDATARQNPTGIVSNDGSKTYTGRLISLDLQDTDIDNALRIIAEVSNLNIIASDDVSGKVTLRLIDVPWDQALDVILKTNGLDQVVEGNVIRIAPVDKLRQEREALREAKRAQQNLEDLKVEYVRVSYARVDELREQVEAVVSERGTVAVDERTNQLIIKDIQSGQKSALELISRLDLRTPQVLLETQIVEGQRNMLRDLGFQWNYNYIQSPATGNATGYNFPNSVTVAGGTSDDDGNPFAVNFPATLTGAAGSAVTAVLDSADGSRSVTMRLSALENEGRVRVVSRPQVATVNNKQAEIKSVETVRVRVPGSGTSIATGSGAAATGGGASAFEEIDVGIELQVTPQASPDYYVLLDVKAKSSAFGSEEVDNIPSTIEREATSTILVKSGQTFALGGVYRINDTDSITGVPWLKDIPFLGWFFRNQQINKRDEELIFFITPHIVEGSFDPSIM